MPGAAQETQVTENQIEDAGKVLDEYEKKLKPVTLLTPSHGIEAARTPVAMLWNHHHDSQPERKQEREKSGYVDERSQFEGLQPTYSKSVETSAKYSRSCISVTCCSGGIGAQRFDRKSSSQSPSSPPSKDVAPHCRRIPR
ncbi:MAG: hypothetical protein AAB588_06610 [Patescibacteria group bacterium]